MKSFVFLSALPLLATMVGASSNGFETHAAKLAVRDAATPSVQQSANADCTIYKNSLLDCEASEEDLQETVRKNRGTIRARDQEIKDLKDKLAAADVAQTHCQDKLDAADLDKTKCQSDLDACNKDKTSLDSQLKQCKAASSGGAPTAGQVCPALADKDNTQDGARWRFTCRRGSYGTEIRRITVGFNECLRTCANEGACKGVNYYPSSGSQQCALFSNIQGLGTYVNSNLIGARKI